MRNTATQLRETEIPVRFVLAMMPSTMADIEAKRAPIVVPDEVKKIEPEQVSYGLLASREILIGSNEAEHNVVE